MKNTKKEICKHRWKTKAYFSDKDSIDVTKCNKCGYLKSIE